MKRISEYDNITTVAENDVLPIVDVSDTSQATTGSTRKGTIEKIADYLKSRVETLTNKTISADDNTFLGFLDWFYPIGTIYETTSTDLDTTTKMNAHFGGTWEEYGSGRVLVAKSTDAEFNTIGKTGGAKGVTLTAAQSGLRSHRHQLRLGSPLGVGSYDDGVGRVSQGSTLDGGFRTGLAYAPTSSYGSNGFDSSSLDDADATSAHTNLQPYIVVFRYRRVS